ncbi:MAG: NAD-dependent epimerase/dehydratase family protein [Caldilineaceae bacterium]|nr:NAD-dependent epimerase/dehydratase family protein [Caldilineaceae bacterium]
MQILITSARHERCAALADYLAQFHEIRLTERAHVETAHEFVLSALGHDRSTNLLTRGMDAIIHAVEPLPDEDVSAQLDAATRCTYNLLMAAAQEGVSQVVLLSTLELMADYPAGYRVQETWRPLPRTQPPTLTKHLAEQVSREFAREGSLGIKILRLGEASNDTVAVAVGEALAEPASLAAKHRSREEGGAEAWSITHIGERA